MLRDSSLGKYGSQGWQNDVLPKQAVLQLLYAGIIGGILRAGLLRPLRLGTTGKEPGLCLLYRRTHILRYGILMV